jgi:hypothetical protein
MSDEHLPSPPPTQFGVFYPLGHVVVALQSHEDAERMRQLLIDGGYDERDVTLASSSQVAAGARELLQSASCSLWPALRYPDHTDGGYSGWPSDMG